MVVGYDPRRKSSLDSLTDCFQIFCEISAVSFVEFVLPIFCLFPILSYFLYTWMNFLSPPPSLFQACLLALKETFIYPFLNIFLKITHIFALSFGFGYGVAFVSVQVSKMKMKTDTKMFCLIHLSLQRTRYQFVFWILLVCQICFVMGVSQ